MVKKYTKAPVQTQNESTQEELSSEPHESTLEEDVKEYMLHYRSLKAESGINIYIQLEPKKLVSEEGVLTLDTSTQEPTRAEYVSGTVNRFFVAKNVLDEDEAALVTTINLNSKVSLKVKINNESNDENWNVFTYQDSESVVLNGKNIPQDQFFDVLHLQWEQQNPPKESTEVVNNE